MDTIEILIIADGNRQQAELICDSENLTITFTLENGYRKSYSGKDFYDCFGNIRKDHPDITFLCKGAKVNVHPSSMSSQMTLGVKAYELTLGKNAYRSDVVSIFDYEEENLTNDPSVQKEFFMRWINTDAPDE
ncbi:hypothetical protein ABIA48_001165 [Pseudomonas sp. S30_BP2TU TE3576]|uniref:hypothetical protein n=1 Tax=Pseudomonas sp. S30_BP2TU TE3576 TaxID=3349329 RepID=UPI003D227328